MPSPPQAYSEPELVERAKHDRAAFGALFELHFDAIFGYVYRRTGDWDAASDITSEVFVNSLEHISRFRWTGAPFSAWLFRIAANQLRMHFRRRKRITSTLVAFAAEQGDSAEEPGPAQKEREAAEQERVAARHFAAAQAALLELPMKYQEVLSLRFFEQKSNDEIATILEKPVGTIKSLVSRGLEQLRRRLPAVQPNTDDGIT